MIKVNLQEAGAKTDSSAKLKAWREIYESFSEEEVAELEAMILDRCRVRQAIEAGLKDSEEGRVMDVREVRARFGLSD